MQFKLATVVAAFTLAGSALGAVVENRQLGTVALQPCGALDLTILGLKAPLAIPCLDNLACANSFTQSLPLPAPLSGLAGLEVDLGVSNNLLSTLSQILISQYL